MDLSRPIQALIPGAQGQLLSALVCAGREMNTKTAAEIAGVSAPHASRVLADLVALGIVRRRDFPPVALYSLVEEAAVIQMLRRLCNLRGEIFEEMALAALEMPVVPVEIIVFGSVARGESHAESDIDVLLVAPTGMLDTDSWMSSVGAWTERVSRFAASPVEVIEVAQDHDRRDQQGTFWRDLKRDGIVVFSRVGATR